MRRFRIWYLCIAVDVGQFVKQHLKT